VVWFLSSLAPRLLRVDLRAESRKLEAESTEGVRGKAETHTRPAYREWEVRAYRILRPPPPTVADLERGFSPERVFVQRIRRGQEILDATPDSALAAGDFVVVAARRHVLLSAAARLGEEVEDRELLDFPLAVLDVVLTRREFEARSLEEVAEEHGRGVVLHALVRGGEEIPFGPATRLDRGDLLRIAGALGDVERVGKALGYVERPSSATDVVFLGVGILVGGLLGALSIRLGDLPLSLTTSGGALIMGLVFGWLRSVRPTFGRIPEPALWVFDTIGLAVFIGVVGLGAGPSFVAGLRATGPSLPIVGFLVAVTPHLTALLFGRYVLRMNPVVLLGACAGAGTVTAALRALQDEAGSKLPVLGYTVPYAIGNILLTAWGPVIVLLTR
jgi:putative transport protein